MATLQFRHRPAGPLRGNGSEFARPPLSRWLFHHRRLYALQVLPGHADHDQGVPKLRDKPTASE